MGPESFLSNELLTREVRGQFESHCPRERACGDTAHQACENSPGGNAVSDIIISTPQPFYSGSPVNFNNGFSKFSRMAQV